MITNGEKILSTKQAPGNIAAINGIRTISTTWVILGHTVALTASYAGKSLFYKKNSIILIIFEVYCLYY